MRVARVPVADRWLAVAVLVVAQVEIWALAHGTAPRVLATGASVVVAAGIGLRRVAPVAALAAVVAATGFVFAFEDIASDDDAYFPAFVLMFAVYSAGAHAQRLRGIAGVLALVVAPVMLSLGDRDGLSVDSVLFFEIFVGPAFAAGVAIAHRRRREFELTRHAERLDRDRERAAEAAVSLERARIARELHDVVAHAISVIVVQSQGGVRMVRNEPIEAEQAFGAIERTGRQALGEMRRLLGMLSADDDGELAPQPSLGHLDELIAEVERAGLPVALVREGDAACVPPGVDVSAYRIVQEALTNALKHAGPASATVQVRCLPTAVEVEVADDGRGVSASNGGGHGLTGMRERVALYGGRLEAGARPSGGFAVSARLPFEAR